MCSIRPSEKIIKDVFLEIKAAFVEFGPSYPELLNSRSSANRLAPRPSIWRDSCRKLATTYHVATVWQPTKLPFAILDWKRELVWCVASVSCVQTDCLFEWPITDRWIIVVRFFLLHKWNSEVKVLIFHRKSRGIRVHCFHYWSKWVHNYFARS